MQSSQAQGTRRCPQVQGEGRAVPLSRVWGPELRGEGMELRRAWRSGGENILDGEWVVCKDGFWGGAVRRPAGGGAGGVGPWCRAAGSPPGVGCAGVLCVRRCRAFLPGRGGGWGHCPQTRGPAREMTGRCLCTAGSLEHRLRCLQKDHCFSGLSTEAAAGTPLPPPGISQAAQAWAGTGGGESQALSVSSARPLPAALRRGAVRTVRGPAHPALPPYQPFSSTCRGVSSSGGNQ